MGHSAADSTSAALPRKALGVLAWLRKILRRPRSPDRGPLNAPHRPSSSPTGAAHLLCCRSSSALAASGRAAAQVSPDRAVARSNLRDVDRFDCLYRSADGRSFAVTRRGFRRTSGHSAGAARKIRRRTYFTAASVGGAGAPPLSIRPPPSSRSHRPILCRKRRDSPQSADRLSHLSWADPGPRG
jgi:hypothetical protein